MENKKTILIVDDEMSIRLLYGEELKDLGYIVYLAIDDLEAFQLLERVSIDLVILDIRLRETNGLEILSFIRNSKKLDVPVIINSAYTEYRDEPMALQADYYFCETSDLSNLIKAIEIILSGGTPRNWSSVDGPPD